MLKAIAKKNVFGGGGRGANLHCRKLFGSGPVGGGGGGGGGLESSART